MRAAGPPHTSRRFPARAAAAPRPAFAQLLSPPSPPPLPAARTRRSPQRAEPTKHRLQSCAHPLAIQANAAAAAGAAAAAAALAAGAAPAAVASASAGCAPAGAFIAYIIVKAPLHPTPPPSSRSSLPVSLSCSRLLCRLCRQRRSRRSRSSFPATPRPNPSLTVQQLPRLSGPCSSRLPSNLHPETQPQQRLLPPRVLRRSNEHPRAPHPPPPPSPPSTPPSPSEVPPICLRLRCRRPQRLLQP